MISKTAGFQRKKRNGNFIEEVASQLKEFSNLNSFLTLTTFFLNYEFKSRNVVQPLKIEAN